ncbi:MAG: ABC transporter substrate-binding protein [Chloroflexi bacterium]|nr:ABC transporter substrate-binding protein [Chloroflexota bacterium]
MTRKSVAGTVALVLGLLLAACSPEPAPTPPPTPAPAARSTQTAPPAAKPTTKPTSAPTSKPPPPPAAKPTTKPLSKAAPAPKAEKVTVLVANLGQEGFLPHNDNMAAYKLLSAYEALWDVDPDTRELRPMLAQTLPEWSEDRKTLNVTLRQGVQFHDGWGELTAEDVKFSIEMAGRKGSVNASVRNFANARVEIQGPYKLAIRLPAPDWAWASLNMTSGRFVLPILSKKYVEKVGEQEAGNMPIGTGPFRLVKHEFGQALEFEAVPNHWRVTPDYKTLVLKVITEPGTAVSMLRTGEADIAAIPLSFVPEARTAGMEIRLQRNIGVIGIGLGGLYQPSRDTFDPNVPWVLAKDPEKALKVRKALNLAVNRQEIIDKVLNGIGGLWPVLTTPNADASMDPAWKPYPYDPEQAKRLLAEAGFPNGFETTMIQFASTGHASREIAEAVAIYWEKIGIKVKRLPMDQATHRTRQVGRKNAGFAYPAWRTYADEGTLGIVSYWSTKATGLGLQFEHPQVEELIARAQAEPDKEKRLAIIREIYKIIYENYLAVPISLEHIAIAASKKVGDWPTLTGDAWLSRFEHIKLK